MRPIVSVFSKPMSCQVSPPSVDLYTPPPGEIELRELGSPVPAQTCMVSDGAIARAPMEMTRWLSKTGRHVAPLLVDFQIPPVAAAAKNVLDGEGIPATSAMRPCMLAGPMDLHRKPAIVVESSSRRGADCAPAAKQETARREGMQNAKQAIWERRRKDAFMVNGQ